MALAGLKWTWDRQRNSITAGSVAKSVGDNGPFDQKPLQIWRAARSSDLGHLVSDPELHDG